MTTRHARAATILACCLLAGASCSTAQDNGLVIGWWNVENLFDTEDHPDPRPAEGSDDEFTPGGSRRWTKDRYETKLANLAAVVRGDLGGGTGPDLLGLGEVENRRVLEDLAARLRPVPFGVVHFDSPDARGIDVAILYRTDRLRPAGARSVAVTGIDVPTRDLLVAAFSGPAGGIVCLVNHWPSRRGGVAETAGRRAGAAKVARALVDSILASDPSADIVLMGDFNDEPGDPSMRDVLGAADDPALARPGAGGALFNTMAAVDREGKRGTYMHRDRWDVLDQFVVSAGLFDAAGYRFREATIVVRPDLLQSEGRYAGYPFPTFGGTTYLGGYSDHLPILLRLEAAAPR